MSSLTASDIDVSAWCMTSFPCAHGVWVRGVSRGTLGAREIYRLYTDNGLEVPDHFEYVAEVLVTDGIRARIQQAVNENDVGELSKYREHFHRYDMLPWDALKTACRNPATTMRSYEMVKFLVADLGLTQIDDECFRGKFEPQSVEPHPNLIDFLVARYRGNKCDLLSAIISWREFPLARYLIDYHGFPIGKMWTHNDHSPLYQALCANDGFVDHLLRLSRERGIRYDREELELMVGRNDLALVKRFLDADLVDDLDYHVKILCRQGHVPPNSAMDLLLHSYVDRGDRGGSRAITQGQQTEPEVHWKMKPPLSFEELFGRKEWQPPEELFGRAGEDTGPMVFAEDFGEDLFGVGEDTGPAVLAEEVPVTDATEPVVETVGPVHQLAEPSQSPQPHLRPPQPLE